MRRRDLFLIVLICCISVGASAASAQTAKPAPAGIETEPPQYGGSLEVGTVHVTINAISWDQGNWPWKFNHDAGNMYETLMAADLNQSIGRGSKYAFTAFGFLPSDAIRGELAESWSWETSMRLVFKLRKGVMYPDKPGVMASREFNADDVIFAQNRMATSPSRSAISMPSSTRPPRVTSTRWSMTSRTMSRIGICASATASRPQSSPRKLSMPAPLTGRMPTAPGRFG